MSSVTESMFRACAGLLIVGLSASIASAQPAPFEPQRRLSFDKLVLAQLDPQDAGRMLMSLDTYHIQRQTIIEQESRIRLDTADGKRLLLKYNRNRSSTVKPDTVVAIIPAGQQQVTVPAAELRFFRLNGQPVAVAEAAEILQSPRPIFLIDDADVRPPQVPEIYRQALNSDCLIAVTAKRIRETKTERLPDSVPEPAKPPPQ